MIVYTYTSFPALILQLSTPQDEPGGDKAMIEIQLFQPYWASSVQCSTQNWRQQKFYPQYDHHWLDNLYLERSCIILGKAWASNWISKYTTHADNAAAIYKARVATVAISHGSNLKCLGGKFLCIYMRGLALCTTLTYLLPPTCGRCDSHACSTLCHVAVIFVPYTLIWNLPCVLKTYLTRVAFAPSLSRRPSALQ